MRARDKETLDALRLISAAVKQIEVDERIEVDDARMLAILEKLAKQRVESIRLFLSGGRDDLAKKEQFELDIIKEYLPTPLTDEEIQTIVLTTISEVNAVKISDMGKLMAALKPKLQGRADMSKVSGIIKNHLS